MTRNFTLFVTAFCVKGHDLTEKLLLGAFEKLRNANISFVTSACPFVRPYGTTRLTLDGLSLKLIHKYFSKVCRGN